MVDLHIARDRLKLPLLGRARKLGGVARDHVTARAERAQQPAVLRARGGSAAVLHVDGVYHQDDDVVRRASDRDDAAGAAPPRDVLPDLQ